MTRKILYLYTLLIPFDNYRFFSVSLSNLVLCLTIPIVICEIQHLKPIKASYFRSSWPVYLSVAFIIGLTIVTMLINPTELAEKLQGIFFNILIVVFFITAAWTIRTSDDYINLLKSILVSSVIATGLGYYEYVYFFLQGEYWQEPELLRINEQIVSPYLIRMKGTYFDTNYFSMMPAIGLCICSLVIKQKFWRTAFALFFILAIVFTFSRMAYLGLLAFLSIGFYGLIRWRWLKQLVTLIIPVTIILSIPLIAAKFQQMNKDSISERIVIIQESTDAFMASPLVGYGLGKKVESEYFLPGSGNVRETHNTFLQALLYGGLVYFSLIIFPVFYYGYKMAIASDVNETAGLIRKFLMNFLPFFLLGLTFLSYLNIKYFWLVYFLLIQYIYIHNTTKNEIGSNISQR